MLPPHSSSGLLTDLHTILHSGRKVFSYPHFRFGLHAIVKGYGSGNECTRYHAFDSNGKILILYPAAHILNLETGVPSLTPGLKGWTLILDNNGYRIKSNFLFVTSNSIGALHSHARRFESHSHDPGGGQNPYLLYSIVLLLRSN